MYHLNKRMVSITMSGFQNGYITGVKMIILNDRSQQYIEACKKIAKELPDFFNEDGIKKISEAVLKHDLFISIEDGEVLGFITIDKKTVYVAEISWMAVERRVQIVQVLHWLNM